MKKLNIKLTQIIGICLIGLMSSCASNSKDSSQDIFKVHSQDGRSFLCTDLQGNNMGQSFQCSRDQLNIASRVYPSANNLNPNNYINDFSYKCAVFNYAGTLIERCDNNYSQFNTPNMSPQVNSIGSPDTGLDLDTYFPDYNTGTYPSNNPFDLDVGFPTVPSMNDFGYDFNNPNGTGFDNWNYQDSPLFTPPLVNGYGY